MRKVIATVIATCVGISVVSPAIAQEKENKQRQVTMSQRQLNQLLSSIQVQLSTITGEKGEKGDKGEAGVNGSNGSNGERGATGEKGATGATGATGASGAKGDKGDKGDQGDSFLTQGLMFLVRGACPTGTTMSGSQNQWMVYNGNHSGRPWNNNGHEIGLSLCLVN